MDEEYSYELKIPKERIAVFIGTRGSVKSGLEKMTRTKIVVDSDEGFATIIGRDPLLLFAAKEVVRAIGRGFAPEIACQLLKQDFLLEVMGLEAHADKKNQLERIRGRIIGEQGKSRRVIEDLTETNISIYGKTVSILGTYEGVATARRAVESLISGSSHAHVYRWLERQRRVRRQRELVERF